MALLVRIALTFLVGAAIFVGLPLVAWGVGDAPAFLSNPVRLGYCLAVFALNAVASVRAPEVGKAREPSGEMVGRQRIAILLLQVVPLAIVTWAPFGDRRGAYALPDELGLRAAGLALYVSGFSLMHVSQMHLGRLFSTQVAIQKEHRLVVDGPYRHVRHPRYLGIILFLSGISLGFRSGLGLALVVAVFFVLLWRIADEEALLSRTFGSEWDAYARRTWRLVPFAW